MKMSNHDFSSDKLCKSARIDLKTTGQSKRLLQEAATLAHTNLTDFLLDAALKEAERLIADQRVFLLNEDQMKTFSKVLDRPAQVKPNLKQLLNKPSVFE